MRHTFSTYLNCHAKVAWLASICLLLTAGPALLWTARPAHATTPMAPATTVTLTASQDTLISVNATGNNYGDCDELTLDKSGGDIGDGRMLVKFDLASIPPDATITSATLQMTKLSGPITTLRVHAHMGTAAWNEGAGGCGGGADTANWNERQTGVNWTAPGGDFHPSFFSWTEVTNLTTFNWNLTSMTDYWNNGTFANHGLVLGSPDTGADTYTFASREHATSAYRPQLTVTYTGGTPIGAISGEFWDDDEPNGARHASETALNGVDVQLFDGLCGEGTAPATTTATTTGDGGYAFTGLAAGNYCVSVDSSTLPVDLIRTTQDHAFSVTLGANESSSGHDFGYVSIFSKDRLSLGLNACNDVSWMVNKVASYGGTVLSGNFDICIFAIYVPPAQQAALQADLADEPETADVGRDIRMRGNAPGPGEVGYPNDPDYNNPGLVFAPQQINAADAWAYSRGDPELIIAILDTGIDTGHEEFTGRLLPGYDYVNGDGDPMDDHGHGTHVAGIAAAGIDNGVGIAGIAGDAKILPMKVLNANNLGFWSNTAQAIMDAVDQGAKVINLSITGSSGSFALQKAIQYANTQGAVVVVAAGNDGVNTPKFPASYDEPNMLSVGAVGYGGSRWTLSNYGPNVDIMAPGQFIHSTYWQSGASNSYQFLTGTSMATPHVTGAAALLMSIDPTLTPQAVIQYLTSTASDLGDPGVDEYNGYGFINLGTAAASANAAAPVPGALTLTKAVDKDAALPDETLTYTIGMALAGETSLTNAVITDTIPTGTTLTPGSISSGGTENNGVIIWALGSNTASQVGYGAQTGVNQAIVSVSQSTDDVEEIGSSGTRLGGPGNIYADSSTLELIRDYATDPGGNQTIGLRFNNVTVPNDAFIAHAEIGFRALTPNAPNANNRSASLIVRGQAADNPSTFTPTNGAQTFEVSARPKTTTETVWNPAEWVAGMDYATPDLSSVVREIVVRPGWTAGNSMVFVIRCPNGLPAAQCGSRTAEAWDHANANPPELIINYGLSPARGIVIDVEQPLVNSGDLITVTMTLTAAQDVLNVTPQLTPQPSAGISLTPISGPQPAAQTVGPDGSVFTWVYSVTSDGAIGEVLFSGNASQTGALWDWPIVNSNSSLVAPPLTFQVTVNNPAGVDETTNIAHFSEESGALSAIASNPVVTSFSSSIGDRVWADADGDAIQDPDEEGIMGVTVQLTDVLSRTITTVTGTGGHYAFGGLEEGAYKVSLDVSTLPAEYTLFSTRHPLEIALADGQNFSHADFGLKRLATAIGDFIWYDADGDGLQDVGEKGIGNVTLELFLDDDDNGDYNPAYDFLVDTTVSGANGAYILHAPLEGNYFVVISDDNGLLTALNHTVGPHSTSTPLPAIALSASEVYRNADYGYVYAPSAGNGVLMGQVWLDGDGSIICEPDEPVILGAQVCATPTTGGASICVDTDLNGRYLLVLPAGDYDVAPTGLPVGLIATTPDPANVTLLAGEQETDLDFGYTVAPGQLSSLGGEIWQDIPVNGTLDGIYNHASEPGIGNVSINVIQDLNQNGNWDQGEPILATIGDSDGVYYFDHVLADDYLVEVSDTLLVLRNYAFTAAGPNPDGDDNNHVQPYAVHLNPGETNTTIDFGYREFEVTGAGDPPNPGVIGNQVWLDMDEDGVFNEVAGDRPIAGVTVDLRLNGSVIRTATTGADGGYLFTDLLFGNYTVQVSDSFGVLSGRVQTQLGSNQSADNHNKAQPYPVMLTFFQTTVSSADFGYLPLAASTRGDCNKDVTVNAGDISALVLEIFDGDGNTPAGALGGSFGGSASGCNANGDAFIDAGDISCTVLIIFNGPDACTVVANQAQTAASADAQTAALQLPAQIDAQPGSAVEIPITFDAGGQQVNNAIFSVDYDERQLNFDPADNDGDGLPDAVHFALPAGHALSVMHDSADSDGELDFTLLDLNAALTSIPDGVVATVTFQVNEATATDETALQFSADPAPAFGNLEGRRVAVRDEGGVMALALHDDTEIDEGDAAGIEFQPVAPDDDVNITPIPPVSETPDSSGQTQIFLPVVSSN